MSKIQTLIVTMNCDDCDELLEKMNIRTDFVIGNQTQYDEKKRVKFRDKNGTIVCRTDKGVGKNRNTALFESDADICILADDDMTFLTGYEDTVRTVFAENQDADVIVFNLANEGVYEGERRVRHRKRVTIFNYMNYGAARLAFRRKAILKKGISFHTCFGGGAEYQSGEDSLFIRECIRKKLKVKAVSECIAKIEDNSQSSWFAGYNKKYFFDKGAFLGVAHPKLCYVFGLLLVVKHKKQYCQGGLKAKDVFRMICQGIKKVKQTGC